MSPKKKQTSDSQQFEQKCKKCRPRSGRSNHNGRVSRRPRSRSSSSDVSDALKGRGTRSRKTQEIICSRVGRTSALNHGLSEAEQRSKHIREIPGFYYDSTKKRYFKITADHPAPSKPLARSCEENEGYCVSVIRRKLKKPLSSVTRCIQERQYLANSPALFRRNALEKLVQQMGVKQSFRLDPSVHNYILQTQFSVNNLQPDWKNERILTVFSCSGYTNSANIVQFSDVIKDRQNNIRLNPNMAMLKTQATTALSWSPHQHNSDFYILSLLGHGNMSGETLLFNVTGRSQRLAARFPVRGDSVWTTEWNRNPLYDNIISIGASRVALTVDVGVKRRVIHVRCSSDVFAQEFAVRSPLLLNGSRDGCVRSCDIRLRGDRLPVLRVSHGRLASITCIKMMKDENYMISSALDGSIKRWDVRTCRCVQEYRGHVNETTHRLPFHLDNTNTLLFAGGQDSVTRIWSVQSGELLRTIPFPRNVDRTLSAIPALRYAEDWGGPGGLPGMMYGTGDTISLYRP